MKKMIIDPESKCMLRVLVIIILFFVLASLLC